MTSRSVIFGILCSVTVGCAVVPAVQRQPCADGRIAGGCALKLSPDDLAPKTDGKYDKPATRVEMNPGMALHDKIKGVVRLTPEQREQRRVIIRNGIVYDVKGDVVPDTQNSHRNIANYVMDTSGNFYLFDEYTTPEIRHSSIMDGGPVAGAGNITIKDGKIVFINSDSGHYPTKPLFPQVLAELQSSGVDVTGFKP